MTRKPLGPKIAKYAATPAGRPSSLVDTHIIYSGDCLDQLRKLPDTCVDLIYISQIRRGGDPPFNCNRNDEVFWGETKEERAFEDRHAIEEAARATRTSDSKKGVSKPTCHATIS